GRSYVGNEGRMEGLGFLDLETAVEPGRIIGRVVARAELWGRSFELVGFENHGGRTRLGPECEPLARVGRGRGNNGRDRTEGAVRGAVMGTYLHGPVLPSTTAFSDALLAPAAPRSTAGAQPVHLD